MNGGVGASMGVGESQSIVCSEPRQMHETRPVPGHDQNGNRLYREGKLEERVRNSIDMAGGEPVDFYGRGMDMMRESESKRSFTGRLSLKSNDDDGLGVSFISQLSPNTMLRPLLDKGLVSLLWRLSRL